MSDLEARVLVFAPSGRDMELTCSLLSRQALTCVACASIDDFCGRIEEGAGCGILTIETVAGEAARARLRETIAAQPPWSDFPLVVMTAGDSWHEPSASWLGKVSLLRRPVNVSTLVATVRTALRARARQYDARAAIEQRDQFLAMLGHELRNPLATILLASESADESGGASLLKKRLVIVERSARHLSRLVDDLLDVSRVTAGKIVLQRSAVDLREVLTPTLTSTAPLARARDVTLALDAPERAIVDGDPLRIAQIVDNLLTNAIKYSRPGGHVVVELGVEHGTVVLRVRDDGIGIAEEMLPRIFDLFAQVEGTLDRANGGMGIGLTLVKRLVELHAGSVSVASEGLGRGSEFTVRLPAASARPALAPAPPSAPEPPPPRVLRAVVVDDNDDLRELGAELVRTLGCEVTTASDGPDGLRCILLEKPDVAFIDIGLPGMTGLEVAQQVRQALRDAAPLLVAMTGYGQARDREEALRAGFDQHLTKPVAVQTFLEVVTRARSRAG